MRNPKEIVSAIGQASTPVFIAHTRICHPKGGMWHAVLPGGVQGN